jgi:ATP-binding cassette subfamily B protein
MGPPHLPADAPPPWSWARLRGSFGQTGRALGLVWRSSPRGTIALLVLTLLSAGIAPVIAYVGKIIVDNVVAANAGAHAQRSAALGWVGVELGLVAALTLVERALMLTRTMIGGRLGIDVNVLILEKARTLELRHFEDPEFYDKLTRARREASVRPLSLVQEHFAILRNGLTLIAYVGLLAPFSGWTVLAVLVASLPAFLAETRFSRLGFNLRNWRSPDMRRLNYLEYVMANDEHAKEVKLFGLAPLLLGRYKALAERFYAEDRRLALRRTLWGYALSLVSLAAFYGCYVLIAVATVAGRLSLGDMTLYVVAFRQGQQAFQAILQALGGMYEDTLYMSNLFEYLAIPVGEEATGGPIASPEGGELAKAPSAGTPDTGVRFERVGFRYPGAEAFALRGIDVHIPAGQSLALVGENGAGKTTFIKLLARLYQPTEGRILIDGRDLRDWDEDALRRRLGVIFQDFNQYHFTVAENVGLGSVEHLEDRPRVERAVERGGAGEVVRALGQGLETQLGRYFAKGTELSGGQWQKVALARAFMREEADILVLDEPTAALDAEAEHAVFQRFRELAAGRTTILISHRFPTVRMADRILVVEHGRIVESGSHEELLAARGRYAHLFTLQASGYA